MTRRETRRCGSKSILKGILRENGPIIRRYFGRNVKTTITSAFLGRSRSRPRHYRQDITGNLEKKILSLRLQICSYCTFKKMKYIQSKI